ncbi:MAG: 30S ribosomal protein S4 [Candidatus Woesearchaeota archaeon]|nr:30S ribosomal protein S4 [Candidatus Woesearchaeota archaeon]
MGDPRSLRKKFNKPSHPWQKMRIDEEKVLMKEYGFKNKVELWRVISKLRVFKTQVKRLIGKHDEKAEQQKVELIARMKKMRLISETAVLEDILAVTMKDLCERRLQTLIFKKGLARSIKQARQFITHQHIMIGERKLTSPSYIVNGEEEAVLRFTEKSAMSSDEHPERVPIQKKVKAEYKKAGLDKKRGGRRRPDRK